MSLPYIVKYTLLRIADPRLWIVVANFPVCFAKWCLINIINRVSSRRIKDVLWCEEH